MYAFCSGQVYSKKEIGGTYMFGVGIIIGLIAGFLISILASCKAYDKGKEDERNRKQ